MDLYPRPEQATKNWYRLKDHVYMNRALSYRNQDLCYKLFLILLIWRDLIGGRKESKAKETTERGNAQCILMIFMKFDTFITLLKNTYLHGLEKFGISSVDLY